MNKEGKLNSGSYNTMQHICKDFTSENNSGKIIIIEQKAHSTNAQTWITFDIIITSIQGKILWKATVEGFPKHLKHSILKILSQVLYT